MNTTQKVEQIKEQIMKELLADIDDKHCVLDLCIENEDRNNRQISKESQGFLDNKKSELIKEHNSGKILFFRKYNYEKILIRYLENKYRVDEIEFDLFPSNKTKRELEEKQKQELEEKQCRDFEENIIKQIPYMKWKKTVRVSSIVYTSVDDIGKKVELYYASGKSWKNNKVANRLMYDNQPLKYAEYDIKLVIDAIEKTHPKNVKTDRIIIITSSNNSKSVKKTGTPDKKEDKEEKRKKKIEEQKRYNAFCEVKEQYIVDLIKEYGIKKQKIENYAGYYQNRCRYLNKKILMSCRFQNRPCTVLFPDCPRNQQFLNTLREERRKRVQFELEPEKQIEEKASEVLSQNEHFLPEIGLKDFVVRGNVFKCMHNKHKIDNIDAIISIDNEGKRQQIKISAGYCAQCKIYFIMDSTYKRLKKKGMILCRITDEKNYYKENSINGIRLAQESLLMQYGYNVSQTEGLTATGRQKILAVIIDNKIMSKSEIISYLDFFISQRSSIPNMEVAISKWETDREFVENYKMGHYSQFGVKAIYRR